MRLNVLVDCYLLCMCDAHFMCIAADADIRASYFGVWHDLKLLSRHSSGRLLAPEVEILVWLGGYLGPIEDERRARLRMPVVGHMTIRWWPAPRSIDTPSSYHQVPYLSPSILLSLSLLFNLLLRVRVAFLFQNLQARLQFVKPRIRGLLLNI